MTTDWTSLPHEILLSIFNHLEERKDIIQCQLTCSNWLRPGEERSFTDIVITSTSSFSSFIEKMDEMSGGGNGNRVHSLLVGDVFDTRVFDWDPFNNFSRAVRLCPEIKKVMLATDINSEYFWRRLFAVGQAGCWNHLQEIPMPKTDWELYWYSKTATFFCKTLTHLLLSGKNFFPPHPERVYYEEDDDEIPTDLFKRVPEFTCLKHLVIKIKTRRNNLYFVESLINDCPTLTSLSLYLLKSNQREAITQPPVNFDQHQNIQEIIGRGLQFNDDSINYLVRKFPNLKKLSLEPHVEHYWLVYGDRVIDCLSRESGVVLANYVSSIPSVDIISSLEIAEIIDIIGIFLSVGGTRPTVCIKYDDCILSNWKYAFYPNLRIRKSTIHNYDGDEDTSGSNNVFLQASFQSDKIEGVPPHLAILSQLGSHIKKLIIEAPFFGFGDVKQDHRRMRQLIGPSFSQIFECNSLETLKIANFSLYYLRDHTMTTKNQSITTLDLELDDFYTWADGLEKLSYCLPALKNLKLDIFPVCNWDTDKQDYTDLADLSMPYSELDSIVWNEEKDIRDGKESGALVYIYLIETAGKSYFSVDDECFNKITCQDYQNAVAGRELICFEINCKSLKSLTIQFSDFHKQCRFH